MCNEIYEWKKTGLLNQDGLFKKLFDEYESEYVIFSYLEDDILAEAHKRFKDVVKLLFTNNAEIYIK